MTFLLFFRRSRSGLLKWSVLQRPRLVANSFNAEKIDKIVGHRVNFEDIQSGDVTPEVALAFDGTRVRVVFQNGS